MAPRTQVRQSQALPVNAAAAGPSSQHPSHRTAAAVAAAARDQQPPWRSSLDLVWSYSRSQAFYGDNIGTSPSFADRRWAGPHRASIAEEPSNPPTPADSSTNEDDYDYDDDEYDDYETEYDEDAEEYLDDDAGQDAFDPQQYSDDPSYDDPAHAQARQQQQVATVAAATASSRRGRGRGAPGQPPTAAPTGYFSSDDEQDHLGRRRSKIPNSRSQVRAVLAQQQQLRADSSAVETSSAISGTDQSTASDVLSPPLAPVQGASGDVGGWAGEQLPPNAIQRTPATHLPPPIDSRRGGRRRSRNPPSAYRGPRSSVASSSAAGDDQTPPPAERRARGLVRRKRSSDRYSIDSDFSTARPTRRGPQRPQIPNQYGAVPSADGDLEAGPEPTKPALNQRWSSTSGEGAPLLGPPNATSSRYDPDQRRLSRISSSNQTISAFSTSVKTPKFIASQGTSTFLQSWFNTLNALIGVGVLALPLAFALTGPILGPILFLLAGSLTNYTGKVLAKIMARNPQLRTYADIGTFAFGSSARWIVTALFCLELWAVSTALLILFGDSVFAVAKFGSPAVWKIVGFGIILPTVFLPLKFLSPISVVGIVSTITLFVVVLADGFIKKEAPGSLWQPSVDSLGPQWSRVPLSFGLIMSGFSSHPVIPSLFKDMKQPHRFPQMLDRAYLVATVIYLGMGLAGYLMFGRSVSDEITRDLARTPGFPPTLNSVAIWLIIINPMAKFALSARPITTTAELVLGVEKSQAHIQAALAKQFERERPAVHEVGGAAAAGRGGPTPRRSSGALENARSPGGLAEPAPLGRKKSVDIPAVRDDRRRSSRGKGKKGGANGEDAEEEGQDADADGLDQMKTPTQPAHFPRHHPFHADDDQEVSTPTQAALFPRQNPFKGADASDADSADVKPNLAATAAVVAPEVASSDSLDAAPALDSGAAGNRTEAQAAVPALTGAPLVKSPPPFENPVPPFSAQTGSSDQPIRGDLRQRPSIITNTSSSRQEQPQRAATETYAEEFVERALNEAGISSSELNPLAASAFSMRVAKMTAGTSPRFKVVSRICVKVVIAVLITLTAILVPGFEKVMAFLGAFLAFASCVFGPLLAHLRIFHRSMSKWRIAVDIAILAVSFVAATFGTIWSFLPR
ncbi:hypothetical protein OC861_004963 [Tilletia horrida]|nr:hypothetical protein OC861_004963 [Tilletia horrida]